MDPSVMFSDLCVLPDGQHGWVVGSTGAAGEILYSIVGTTNGVGVYLCTFRAGNKVRTEKIIKAK